MKSGEFFKNWCNLHSLRSPEDVTGHPLRHIDAVQLLNCGMADARGMYYNSVVSIGSAFMDYQNSSFSWSIIKSYYSCFFSIRSILASHGIEVVYLGAKPFEIQAKAGWHPVKRKGNTHDVVFTVFRERLPGSRMIVNMIDLEDPIKWLRSKREEVNYRTHQFPDPIAGESHKNLGGKLRQLLEEYIKDDNFAFDSDHAVLAFPLLCLIEARKAIGVSDLQLSPVSDTWVRGLFKDANGPFSKLIGILLD